VTSVRAHTRLLSTDADLAVALSDSPDPVVVGQPLAYKVSVTNAGPAPAAQIVVTDILPGGVTFQSATGGGWTCGESAGTVTCTRPALDVGPAPDLTITVQAPAAPTILGNGVSVTSAQVDGVTGNDTDTEETTVVPTPHAALSITKSDGGVTARWKQPLTYTIVATNGGPDPVTGAVVTDTLPGSLSGAAWTCVASAGSSCAPGGAGNVSDAATLLAGGTATYTVTATVGMFTFDPIENTATVAAPAGVVDADLADNTASTSTPVTDVIFADGFESGDLSAWSSAQTDGTDLLVRPTAAMDGTGMGLRARVNDVNSLYVADETPRDESIYRARFWFDPNGFDPGLAQSHLRTRIFILFEENPTRRLAAVVLRRLATGQLGLMARARLDDNTQADTGFVTLTDAPHAIEVAWTRSATPEAADGSIALWIDGVPSGRRDGLDNNRSSVDFVRLGALSVKTGAAGTLFFDEFVSRFATYIGP